jgi:hypothetical protein
VKLGERVRVFSSDSSFAWPGIRDLSPGYVIARVTEPNERFDRAQVDAHRKQLLGKLGRLDLPELDYLSNAWLRTCEATTQPKAARAKDQSYVDVGLCKLDLSIFDAMSAIPEDTVSDGRDALCAALHEAFFTIESLSGTDLYGIYQVASLDMNLRSAATAFVGGDRATFDQEVRAAGGVLNLMRLTKADPTAIEAAFKMMARHRNW